MRIATNNSHSWQSQTLFWANNMDNTLTLIKNIKLNDTKFAAVII